MNGGGKKPVNICINRDANFVLGADEQSTDQMQLTLDDAIIFPGLINAHDHLDFNLFPALGSKTYNNYTEWGKHIHETYKSEIDAVLKVPIELREEWGVYKNLLCGVTTVVNHGAQIKINEPLITVFEDNQSLHSVAFEEKWKAKLNNPLRIRETVTIHTGEGTDGRARTEIDELIRWNIWRRPIVAVHGVAMTEEKAKQFKAVIWCPDSNYFLLNKTARVDLLKHRTKILFGTDSTLTGGWNIWNHIRLARKTKMLTDQELFDSLTSNPALIWTDIANKTDAVVAKRNGKETYLQSFFNTDPADILLIIKQGRVILFDEVLLPQLHDTGLEEFSVITINGTTKHVKGDLPALAEKIRAYYPEAVFPFTN